MPESNISRPLLIGTICFYVFTATSMVLANKWVLATTETPLFYLLVQLLIAVLLFALAGALKICNLPPIDLSLCKTLLPLIVVNALGLSFNNFTLKFVDASYYQVARGLVLPLTVIFSSISLAEPFPSPNALLACATVSAGFFIGVIIDSPTSQYRSDLARPAPLSSLGIAFGFMSSATTAMHAIIIKQTLTSVRGNALELAWYSNVLTAVIMIPVVLLVEGPRAMLRAVSGGAATSFVIGALVTGSFGFLISIAGFLSIKITSPITHMVVSAIRGVVQALLSTWLFHDGVTFERALSIVIILIGSMFYTWVKNKEIVERQREEKRMAAGGLANDSLHTRWKEGL